MQPGSGLGILRDDGESRFARPTPLNELPEFLHERLVASGDLLVIGKTNRRSRVHRRARMDDVSVRVLRPDGTIAGLLRVIGLFTSLVYLEQASRTPLLRRKLQAIIEAEGLMEGSHDYKATVAAFESFPRDELFQAPVDALRAEIVAAARAEEAQRVTLTVRQDAASRNITVMVAMPGDRMSTELRMRLQDLLAQRFHAESVEYHLALVEDAAAQLFFLLHIPAGQATDVPLGELEQEVARLARTWDDRLADELTARYGDAEGRRLAVLYSARLPGYYKSATPPDLALADIALLERVAAGEEFAVGLQNELAAHTQVGARPLTRVAVATTGGKIPLGEFLPILEALGLTVVEEVPTRLDGGDDGAYLHDFGVLVDDAQLSCERDGERISDAITAIWSGRVESDTLNALVVRAGLRHDDVVILRAYRRYRRIVAPTFTAAYQNDVLASHPQTARALVELFRARFCDEPDEAREQELRAQVEAQLAAVGSLDEDRILRGFAALIDATVRTNAALGRPYLSFKLRSADVPQMPEPAPLFEIFVYHPLVEGIHLRGGRVARGGIRWSDRREDYRSEVLGLMKAQMVKNAVIVPVGAKGGFVLRAPPANRDLLRAEVQLRYSTLIRGMLDVTDNIVGGEVVRPAGVRAFDEDDPYLVVAADKGTAALSDTANAIALEYGFWLGDAFASGGSKGYDHKQLGITARGAWESVKRHFRELGRDVDSRPFTVAGIGDMSGDVFGNGMLLSRQIQLVAAFDHRHVFLDPAPDAAASLAERRRLFELGAGTSWDDYDHSLISAGGGVWPRTVKSVPLSPEARVALGIEAESLDPDELVRAILRAPVDLLWNGGVGTFVKASDETHAEVGDRDNDAIRVDGRELRARVVGEGGNLGLTQLGRIEYASAGGRINTDAIDNSAGVDCSDHEVNIKILLGAAVERGSLTLEGRDELLAAAADEVCDLVLYDNYLQAQILSQEQEMAPERVEAHEMLMHELELEGLLHRELEALPSGDRLAERRRQGRGLTRPELAVLMAYAKRSLYPKVLESEHSRRSRARFRAARLLPAPHRRGHRRALPRAPAAARDRRDVRDQRRRQLAGHRLGLADDGRDRCRGGGGGARLLDRARGHRRGRALGGGRGAVRGPGGGHGRADGGHGRGRRARRGRLALVPAACERRRRRQRDRPRPRVVQRALADAARRRQWRLAGGPRPAARGAGRARAAAAAGRGGGVALGAHLRARRDRRRACDGLLAGRGGRRVLRARRAAQPGLAGGSARRHRGRDALAALGAGGRARRAARDASRAHRTGHRGGPRRAHGRGRRPLSGRAGRRARPRSAPRCEPAGRRHGGHRGRHGRRPPGQECLRMSSTELLDLNRAALVLIDVQQEYFAEGGPLRIPDGPMVLAKLRSLLEDYREANMPIVHIRHEEAPGAPVFAIDGPRVEFMPDVAPRHIEPVVIKHAPGAFTDTELSQVLGQLAVRSVVIAGFMTHMCCDTTARQAQERGLDVIFLTDGTATRTLSYGGRTIDYHDVQAATLAAQADGFSRLADVSLVRASLADGMGY